MFIKKKEVKKTDAEETLEYLYGILEATDPKDEAYTTLLKHIELAHRLRAAEPQRDKVSKETWIMAGVNLLGIVMVLGYERANVVTSKAFSMISKNKI